MIYIANRDQIRALAIKVGSGGKLSDSERTDLNRTLNGVGREKNYVERLVAGGPVEPDMG